MAESDEGGEAEEDAIEIGQVGEAERALKKGDQAGAVGAIKRLGRRTWSLVEQLGLALLKRKAEDVLGLPPGTDG